MDHPVGLIVALDITPSIPTGPLTGCFQIALVIVRSPTPIARTSPTLTVSTYT